MIFRNVTLFQLPPGTPELTHEALAECALKPVGPLEMSSRGFVPPIGHGAEQLVIDVHGVKWVTVGGEDRILPSAVISDLLAKKLEAIERQEGRRPGGRTRKRIKDDLIVELLPRALVRPSRVSAVFLPRFGMLAVDTASRKVAEGVAHQIRRALGSFPALPLVADISPGMVMTDWVEEKATPVPWEFGSTCELRDASDPLAVVRYSDNPLTGDEVYWNLGAGKRVTRLEVYFAGRSSFVLCDDLVLRRFKLLDAAIDQLGNAERDDVAAEMEARLVLFAAELSEILRGMGKAFRLVPP